MQRITQANLDRLAENITKQLDNGTKYGAGQIYGLRWSFVRGVDGLHGELINQPTKTALYDHMHTFLEGVREAQQVKKG